MDAPRLKITGRLRSIMSYDKLSGEVPRVLILRSQYWLDGACESAAQSLGWEVTSVPIPMEGALTRDHIAHLLDAIVTTRPDFILSINLAGMDLDGMWARFFEDLRLPYVVWFVDDPRTIIMGRNTYASQYALALTWDESYADYLSSVHFPHVKWLPLAADIAHFNASPVEEPVFPPTFVGNSMEDFAERSWRSVNDDPVLQNLAHDAFDSGRVTREHFATGLSAIIGDAQLETLDAEQQRSLEMLFFIEGTRRFRRASVEQLLESGIEVRGDDGWRRWLPNALPPLDYFTALPEFYRQCCVNLNFTSIQMPTGVNQRVFDCPAAGGFLLTDAQGDVSRLFAPGDEIQTFASMDECRDRLRFFAGRPDARRTVIEKAKERILREHTYAHRLRTIARWVMEFFG